MLNVKEIFGPTIQGEGETSGSKCIFIRLAGCNAWNGQPETKKTSLCPYCDTDFIDGINMSIDDIINKVKSISAGCLVVISGGEPLIHDEDLLCELANRLFSENYTIQVETNGTINKEKFLSLCRYVSCSPKVSYDKCKINWNLVTSVKLLFPHKKVNPESFIENLPTHIAKYIQPIYDDNYVDNVNKTVQFIYDHENLKLSLQTHKLIGVQ